MKDLMPSGIVDLIYLDPPFNSNENYNISHNAPEQELAFTDTWRFDRKQLDAARKITGIMKEQGVEQSYIEFWKLWVTAMVETDPSLLAYLVYMIKRLLYMKPILKLTGSIYLHCDPTASHYIKVMMDAIFGGKNFKSEVIWKRTSAHNNAKRWGPIHDVILYYTKSDNYTWNDDVTQRLDPEYVKNNYSNEDERGQWMSDNLTGTGISSGDSGKPWRGIDPTLRGRHWSVPQKGLPTWFAYPEVSNKLTTQERLDALDAQGLIDWPDKKVGMPRFKRYYSPDKGMAIQDIITDIPPVSVRSKEYLKYPTQKPNDLLKRIISASSNKGDLVFDPFCGCGTTINACEELERNWIGCDISISAIKDVQKRLMSNFLLKEGEHYKVNGLPVSFEQAEHLFHKSPYLFQDWMVKAVGGKISERKSGDGGIDGKIWFVDQDGKTRAMVLSVKGSKTLNPSYIRELQSRISEEAPLAGFLCLNEPRRGVITEALSTDLRMGLYKCDGKEFSRLQILSVKDLFRGEQFKTPPRKQIKDEMNEQPYLF